MDQTLNSSKIKLNLKTCPSYFEASENWLGSDLPGKANFVLASNHVLKQRFFGQGF